MHCPACHAENSDAARFCRQCGQALSAPPSTPLCRHCTAPLKPGATFCSRCGEPTAPAEPVAQNPRPVVPVPPEAAATPTESKPANAAAAMPPPVAEPAVEPAREPIIEPPSDASPQNRKPMVPALGAALALAIAAGTWFYKGTTPPTATPAATSAPPQAPAAVTAVPEASKPAEAAPAAAVVAEETAAAEPRKIEKKAVPKKPAKKETPPVHNEAPVVAPPAPPPPRGSLDALRRELLECEKRNFFARPLCRERAQDRHCPDSHFSTTPECQRSGDASQNRGG